MLFEPSCSQIHLRASWQRLYPNPAPHNMVGHWRFKIIYIALGEVFWENWYFLSEDHDFEVRNEHGMFLRRGCKGKALE